MKISKTVLSVFTLFLGITLISGCTSTPSDNAASTTSAVTSITTSPVTTSDKTEQTDPQLSALYKIIDESDYHAGMAYIGFVGSETTENEIRIYVKSSQYAEKYPFLCDAPIVDAGGTELYAVVTTVKECRASVYRAEMTESGEYDVRTDNAYYDGKGLDCFLLRCNISDIHSNVAISFTNGDKISSVFPMLSGMDGKLCTDKACYDFSVYTDDGGKKTDDVVIAYELLSEAAEVQRYTDMGMILQYTGKTQVIDGRSCWIFALGTDHEGQFVREFYYGVCDNLIYSYDAINDKWNVLGAE